MFAIRAVVAVVAVALLSACTEKSPLAPEPLPALQSAVWHVHQSDGQALPALLGHRLLPGAVLEQDFLDSAQFVVDADGTWEHRAWYQRFRAGEFYQVIATLDWGTWTATTEAYEFRRNTGELIYTLAGPANDQWQINLRYPNQDGVAVSTLRSTRPALSVAGHYRATALHDQPLPRAYIIEPEFNNGTAIVTHYVMIDSAFVSLQSNGSYRHNIFYSHWEGPVGGAPEVRLIGFRHSDFGSWSVAGTGVTLESGWLQNHVIFGERAASDIGPLHLNHGISHGDEPAPLRYVRN